MEYYLVQSIKFMKSLTIKNDLLALEEVDHPLVTVLSIKVLINAGT